MLQNGVKAKTPGILSLQEIKIDLLTLRWVLPVIERVRKFNKNDYSVDIALLTFRTSDPWAFITSEAPYLSLCNNICT